MNYRIKNNRVWVEYSGFDVLVEVDGDGYEIISIENDGHKLSFDAFEAVTDKILYSARFDEAAKEAIDLSGRKCEMELFKESEF